MADFPNKPIRIITSIAGSDMDLLSRLLAEEISGSLGQPVTIENVGAGKLAENVYKAPPDGHTLLVTPQTLWIAPLVQKDITYDPVKDFAPISLAATSPLVFFAHPSVAANSIVELIALAKARPGELTYCSGLDGSTSQLGGGLFNHMAGIKITRIPYKSGQQAMKDLVAGKVDLMIPSAGMGMDHVKEGKLRALAVTSAQPSAAVPGLPTVASGLPGYEVVQTIGILAPAKTPAPIVKRLNQEMVRALNQPDVKQKLLHDGVEVVGSSPEEFAAKIKSEIARWGEVIKNLNDIGMPVLR